MHLYDEAFYVKSRHTPIGIFNVGNVVPREIEGILSLMGYTGCACFNYKMEERRPLIFEMNPRIGASFYRVANQYLAGYVRAINLMNTGGAFSRQKTGELNPKTLKRLVAANIRKSLFSKAIFRKSKRILRPSAIGKLLQLLLQNTNDRNRSCCIGDGFAALEFMVAPNSVKPRCFPLWSVERIHGGLCRLRATSSLCQHEFAGGTLCEGVSPK